MIQWFLSQPRAGNRKVPVKVAPACSLIVSPQWAPSNAACTSPPASTLMTGPGARRERSVLYHRTPFVASRNAAETQKRNRPEFESVVLDCPHPVVQRLQVAKEKYPNLSASYFSTFASVLIGFDAS